MIISEYIKQQLEAIQVQYPDSLITAEIESLGYNDELLHSGTKKRAKEVLCNIIPIILITPVSVSEGGYSVSYDKDSLLKFYNLLCKELGLENQLEREPTVKDISDQW